MLFRSMEERWARDGGQMGERLRRDGGEGGEMGKDGGEMVKSERWGEME